MSEPELFKAAEAGDTEAVVALLAAGAPVNDASPSGETALMRATSKGRLDVVRLLLGAGADVNARRSDGMTPLIYAAFFGHADVAQCLIDGGADLDASDRLGMRALDWAKSKGAMDTADILRRAAAAPERRPPASYHGAGHVIESEEILDLPEAGAVTTADDLADGMLDLSGGQESQEHNLYAHPLQPDVNATPAEPAESSRNRAADGGRLENADASGSAAAATSIRPGGERPQYGDGTPEESGRRVNTSAASAVVARVPPAERPDPRPRPSLNSEPETEGGAASGAFSKFFTQREPPSWIQLAALSLTIMIGTAALTWVIFRRDESRVVKSRPEAVSPPARDPTPQAAQKSDDGVVLTAALNDWLEATRTRDIEKQMSFYAPNLRAYYRRRYVSDSVVRAEKAKLFGRARRVDISAGEPEIRFNKNSPTATMRFRKVFLIESDAGSRSGEVMQELIWRKTNAGWRIISERDETVVR